ncbi:MAG: RidA family protein [Anaerolineales bacterium]|nr:RidA family protein [Anaerolineales bacterium]
MKEFRNPQNMHQPIGAYMHQAEISTERMLIISGQVGMKKDGTVPEDPIEQLDLVFENILRNLEAADMEMKDLVKINYYLVGEWDIARRREIVASKLAGHKPCSTLVYVAALASPIYKVEVEAWASRADKS